MPDNGDSSDREELQGATGFEEGLTGLRDNPAGGEFLERELGSDDFLAPPEVKAGWIYRLKKPELMELASSLQINPEGTVIELRRRLIWHLVELPKARGTSTSPNEGTGTYFHSMGRQNTGAVPRRDFSYSEPMEEFVNDTTYTRRKPTNFSRDGVTRNYQHKFGEHTYDDDVWSTQYHGTLCGTWFAGPQFNSNECFRTPGKSLTNPFDNCTVRSRCGPPWISHSVENTSMEC
ncbi:hypothetical protein JTB14_024133 [Gonioctena quinquepunctata]|nr:hypothetical protein JTB14_024133 [Gonioctena quinquepunctata]